MAIYKVLQDIEAEDKLVGPLTLRQCIYAAIAALAGYLSYICAVSGAAFMVVFFLPFIGVGVFFAFPWNKQQSTEVWALAKVRFMLKPRRRIWNQSGMKHLVEVTVPKVVEDPRGPRMSPFEVQNRLKALAATVDSRGWAVKNVPLDMYTQAGAQGTDRLTDASTVYNAGIDYKETSNDDMFDLDNNPIAQQFAAKMTVASQAHRQQIVTQMANPQAVQPVQQTNWYSGQTGVAGAAAVSSPAGAAPSVPGVPQAANPTPQEIAFAEDLKRRQQLLYASDPAAASARVMPAAELPTAPAAVIPSASPAAGGAAAPVTPPINPAILELANNNDLNVATIAREAQHRSEDGSNEVVVSLH